MISYWLFGSLLKVTHVITFIPQTYLYSEKHLFNNSNINYIDLKKHINSVTKYKLIGDVCINVDDVRHHIKQCDNLKDFKNVEIIYKKGVFLREIRDSGELKNLIFEFVND